MGYNYIPDYIRYIKTRSECYHLFPGSYVTGFSQNEKNRLNNRAKPVLERGQVYWGISKKSSRHVNPATNDAVENLTRAHSACGLTLNPTPSPLKDALLVVIVSDSLAGEDGRSLLTEDTNLKPSCTNT